MCIEHYLEKVRTNILQYDFNLFKVLSKVLLVAENLFGWP